MRWMRVTGYWLAVAGICAMAGTALALDQSSLARKRPLLVPHKAVSRAAARGIQRPAVAAIARSAPRLAFRAPQQKLPVAAAVAPVPAPKPADPAKPQLLAQSGDWSVFHADIPGGQTCFMATQPKDSQPRQASRAPAYVYLTSYWPGAIRHELTIQLGMTAAAGGVTATIDGRDFALLAKDTLAYPPDETARQDLLRAMRVGHTMVLKIPLGAAAGQAATGPAVVTDSVSLLGVGESLRATDYACSDAYAAKVAGP